MYQRHTAEAVCERFNFDVVDSTVSGPDGRSFIRTWARHGPTVATVAVTAEGTVPLVKQYRVAIDGLNLELPGGRIDPGDSTPAVAAARELREEIGVNADLVVPLGSFLNSPGHCSQRTVLFLASGLKSVGRSLDDDEESTSVVEWMALADLDRMIAEGHVQDAKTLVGLMLAARRLGLS